MDELGEVVKSSNPNLKMINPNSVIISLIYCLALAACGTSKTEEEKEISFYVGTYTLGESEGIYRYQLKSDGSLSNSGLVAKTENPSFLIRSADGKYLLAANENSDENGGGGSVSSFAIDGEKLAFIDEIFSGGDSPCFLSEDQTGYVLVANYGSGNVGLLKLESTGLLNGPLDVLQHEGKGTHQRQQGPHAHSACFTGSDNEVITVDLGTNELWFSRLDRDSNKLVLMSPAKLTMAPGSGPRHLAFHPTQQWIYVINELTSTITQLSKNSSGQYEIAATQSTLPTDYEGENLCADIHISSDGQFLYASNRGHNSIVVFQIDSHDGSLSLVGHEDVHGDWPRNFTLSPDGHFLLVANQRSNNIVSFKRSQETGTLEFVGEIDAPSPVCLLF
ncbi:MAG TPA: lactonase family protein [Cyclobacteriaceae bacterium]